MILQNDVNKNVTELINDIVHVIRSGHIQPNEPALSAMWPLLAKNGFHRMLIDSRYGGKGLELREYISAIRQLAYGDGAIALAVHVHNFAVYILNELGNEQFRQRLNAWLDQGSMVSLARSEHGRDYRYDFATRIVRVEKALLLSGQKDFCTLAGLADYYVVFAQTTDSAPSMDSLQVCVADAKHRAVEVMKTNGLEAMAASSTYSVRFTEYELSPVDLIGEPGSMSHLINPDLLTLGFCAINLGMAEYAADQFIEHERKLNHKTASNHEVVRWLGRMDVYCRSAELLLNEAILSRPHNDEQSGVCLRRAKAASDQLIQEITEGAVQYSGIEGLMSKNNFLALRNNAYATRVLPPNIQRCLMALGMERAKK
ncbi:acyl-CoA dehydrogenase family protein [Paenibacillus abyssi]|uniref:Acyl-CoA dehydrogenase n=1 Tax=Paenibacillus abyssi TaxID=1340531 RepID=A0A917D8M6_9BACL|nr:acyl-CoA dehydrogenase family protein [Paenibacillus abyssi]GGG13630.1 acyl-CoA dehydrogenase [Paenibacillus abyssi]